MGDYNERDAAQSGRLVFINPNGVNDDIDNVPLTPHYEDLSISVNLVVEVVNRFKTDSLTGENREYVISWSSKQGEENQGNISFLSGTDAKEFCDNIEGNYLTTYYTDIHISDIREKNIIEGLGITNVDISYDNMYMPTITIKFVDVRGSAIFSREESAHTKDKLTSETIFGCFFTLPYPKFKLQVKGFYGDAVTYQLACTSFKAKFNSQTGNFEITTTFIGYQYSLLTDIPFAYIMAAPYSTYIGEEYWNSHIGTDEWKLANGESMERLYDIYHNLKNSLRGGGDGIMTDGKICGTDIASDLKELDAMWQKLLKKIQSGDGTGNAETMRFVGYDNSGDTGYLDNTTGIHYWLVVTKNPENISDDSDISNWYNTINEEIRRFNEDFYQDKTFTLTNLPDPFDLSTVQIVEETTISNDTTSGSALQENVDNSNNNTDNTTGGTTSNTTNTSTKSKSSNTTKGYQYIDGTLNINEPNMIQHINSKMTAQAVYGFTDSNNTQQNYENNKNIFWEKYGVNGALLSDGGLKSSLNEGLNIVNSVDEAVAFNMQESLPSEELCKAIGFKPYIGNFMKIIIAHLETLTAMIYQCADNIMNQIHNGGRTPGEMGVSLSATDIENNGAIKQITPFPAVYKKDTVEGKDEYEPYDVLGWVGDFSPNFEEEKLINGIHKAIMKSEATALQNKEQNYDASHIFPVMPLDIYKTSSFDSISNDPHIGDIAGLLGIRLAQLWLTYNDAQKWNGEMFKKFGQMDALKFLNSKNCNKDFFKKLFFKEEKDSKELRYTKDNLLSIMKFSVDSHQFGINDENTNGVYFNFCYSDDIINVYKKHAIYQDNSNNLEYTYIRKHDIKNPKETIPLVPTIYNPNGASFFKQYLQIDTKNKLESENGSNKFKLYNPVILPDSSRIINDMLMHYCDERTLFGTADDDLGDDAIDYMNDSMFHIITDQNQIEGIRKRVEELKSEKFKFKNSKKEFNFKDVIDKIFHLGIDDFLSDDQRDYAFINKKKENLVKYDDEDPNMLTKDRINTSKQQFELGVYSEFDKKVGAYFEVSMIAKEAFKKKNFNKNDWFISENRWYIDDNNTLPLAMTSFFNEDYNFVNDKKINDEINLFFKIYLVFWSIINSPYTPLKPHTGKIYPVYEVPFIYVLRTGVSYYLNELCFKYNIKDKFKNGFPLDITKGSYYNNFKNESIVSRNKDFFGQKHPFNDYENVFVINKFKKIAIEWGHNEGRKLINGMLGYKNGKKISWRQYYKVLKTLTPIIKMEGEMNLPDKIDFNERTTTDWLHDWISYKDYKEPKTDNKEENVENIFINWNHHWDNFKKKYEEKQKEETKDSKKKKYELRKMAIDFLNGNGEYGKIVRWCGDNQFWTIEIEKKANGSGRCNNIYAYWRSNASFQPILKSLYFDTCLICTNVNKLNDYSYDTNQLQSNGKIYKIKDTKEVQVF